MKAKRLFAALLALVMILALAACGETGETEGAGKGDTIRLVNGKTRSTRSSRSLPRCTKRRPA